MGSEMVRGRGEWHQGTPWTHTFRRWAWGGRLGLRRDDGCGGDGRLPTVRPWLGPPAHPRRLLRTGGTSPRAARRPRERGASPSGLPLMGPQCSACPARPGILLGEGCAPRTPAGRGLGLVLRPWVGPPARHHPQALQARPSECLGAEGRGQAKSGWPPQGEWAGNALALAARPATPVDSRTRDPSP